MLPLSTRPHIRFNRCRDAKLSRVVRAERTVLLHGFAHLVHIAEVAVCIAAQHLAVHVNLQVAAATMGVVNLFRVLPVLLLMRPPQGLRAGLFHADSPRCRLFLQTRLRFLSAFCRMPMQGASGESAEV